MFYYSVCYYFCFDDRTQSEPGRRVCVCSVFVLDGSVGTTDERA